MPGLAICAIDVDGKTLPLATILRHVVDDGLSSVTEFITELM
jgi:hypothetical protein